MKKYAVSIVWTRNEGNGSITTQNSVRIVDATNENEAFGLACDSCIDVSKGFSMICKVVVEIPIQ